jgi:anti-sigma-K factor RskA
MTDVDNHEELSPNELLAAEYALGVLAGTERTAAAQRVARDRAFAALVAAWEERLAPWTAELPEVAPPPQVWERIAARLSGAQRQRPRFWQSLVFWRGFGIVSTLAAACLAVLLYLSMAPQQAVLVAAIEGDGQRFFVARRSRWCRRPTGPTQRVSPSCGWSLPAANRCPWVFCPQTAPPILPSPRLLPTRPGAMSA